MERVRLEPKPKYKGFTSRPPNSGRKPGQPNKTTRILKEAILLAAEQVGQDKRGKDGLVGYLKRIALTYPEEFCTLLAKVLPLQITGPNDGPLKSILTIEEARQKLLERGLPMSGVFDGPAGPAEILPPSSGSGNGVSHH
jgi:hypothetical protein